MNGSHSAFQAVFGNVNVSAEEDWGVGGGGWGTVPDFLDMGNNKLGWGWGQGARLVDTADPLHIFARPECSHQQEPLSDQTPVERINWPLTSSYPTKVQ